MKSVGMMIQQVQSGQGSSGKSKVVMGEQAKQFQRQLNQSSLSYIYEGEDADSKVNQNNEVPLSVLEELPEDLQDLLMDHELTGSMFLNLINQDNSSDDQALIPSFDSDSIPEELLGYKNQIMAAMGDIKVDNIAVNDNPKFIRLIDSNPIQTDSNRIKTDNPTMQKQFASLISQALELISKLNTQEDIQKASPKILELLQQWKNLSKSTGNKDMIHQQILVNNDESGDLGVFKNVLETFQKREHFAGKHLYDTDSKVTATDISKWISKALETDKINTQQVSLNVSMPISKLEQYAIYINQSQTIKSADDQLMEQFTKIMNSSKLSSAPNGMNQLSITLRPDHLGEMMVRFTQINGEMTVKILVISAAAKEMLESNIHQLKSMFSPHQVVVEKQELNAQSANTQKEQEGEQLKDQGEQSSGQSNQKDNQSGDTSFELQFEELLMNEKV
ncbi:flagellar hook-length control protein FliK [Oceanobacillus longus]|uniref:Flagellar hook-length control protein FliK n=1 Tax=Oceanobacillus longus TaxID=930120 RepID=A0ABV8GTC6_9BACI